MKISELLESIEPNSIDSLFNINGEIIQTFLNDFDLFRGELLFDFKTHLQKTICRLLWEQHLYELLEENILRADGYSITVDPELRTNHHDDEFDCYAALLANNNRLLKFVVFFNTDTDVEDSSFAQQITTLISNKTIGPYSFRLSANTISSNIPNWEQFKIDIFYTTIGNIFYTDYWGKILLNEVLKQINPMINIVKYPDTRMDDRLTIIINSVDKKLLLTIKEFFQQYNISTKAAKDANGIKLIFRAIQ